MDDKQLLEFKKSLQESTNVLIVQAENPDGDSLATALAMESIIGEMGKEVSLHCSTSVPDHLKHLPGWDRVTADIPPKVDMVVFVDVSVRSLLEKTLRQLGSKINSTKNVIIDHHQTEQDLGFEFINIIYPQAVASGEVVYELAQEFDWELSLDTKKLLATSILSDSLGLMTENTTARSIAIIAELVEGGVSLAELDMQRKEMMRRDQDITRYKGELLSRVDYSLDGSLAHVLVTWDEIEKYSSRYNPAALVLEDMRLTKPVKVAIVFKTYPDGKLTAKIRSNHGYPVARDLAQSFGGGGHPYAAGFKLQPGDFDETLNKVRQFLVENLDETA